MITTLARWIGYLVLGSFAAVVITIVGYFVDHVIERLTAWWQSTIQIELRDQPRSRFASRRKAEAIR